LLAHRLCTQMINCNAGLGQAPACYIFILPNSSLENN